MTLLERLGRKAELKAEEKSIFAGRTAKVQSESYQKVKNTIHRRIVDEMDSRSRSRRAEWKNSPMLEGELILFLDTTNHVSLDEIQLFYDEKKGLEWEVEKRG